jgi:hypothetical protein
VSLSLAARRARLLAVRDQIDAGGGGALHLYADTLPPNPETPAASAPLAIIALAPVSCVLHPTAASMSLVEAVGNAAQFGQATWARYVDGNGAAVYDTTAGPPGSGAEVIVTDGLVPPGAVFYVGGEITVSHTFTESA